MFRVIERGVGCLQREMVCPGRREVERLQRGTRFLERGGGVSRDGCVSVSRQRGLGVSRGGECLGRGREVSREGGGCVLGDPHPSLGPRAAAANHCNTFATLLRPRGVDAAAEAAADPVVRVEFVPPKNFIEIGIACSSEAPPSRVTGGILKVERTIPPPCTDGRCPRACVGW